MSKKSTPPKKKAEDDNVEDIKAKTFSRHKWTLAAILFALICTWFVSKFTDDYNRKAAVDVWITQNPINRDITARHPDSTQAVGALFGRYYDAMGLKGLPGAQNEILHVYRAGYLNDYTWRYSPAAIRNFLYAEAVFTRAIVQADKNQGLCEKFLHGEATGYDVQTVVGPATFDPYNKAIAELIQSGIDGHDSDITPDSPTYTGALAAARAVMHQKLLADVPAADQVTAILADYRPRANCIRFLNAASAQLKLQDPEMVLIWRADLDADTDYAAERRTKFEKQGKTAP